jgi:hypothetical protein
MSDSPGTLELIGRHLLTAIKPLQVALSSPDEFLHLMARLGWNANSLPPQYSSLATQVDAAIQALEGLPDQPSEQDILNLLHKSQDVYVAMQGITVAPPGVDVGTFLSEVKERLFELLLTDYLASDLPTLYNLGLALNIIVLQHVPSSPTRPAYTRTHFHWDQFPAIVDDPLILLALVYGWRTPRLNFIRILEHLSELLVALGLRVSFHRVDETLTRAYSEIPENPLMGSGLYLRIPFFYTYLSGNPVELAFDLREVLAAPGKLPGLVLEPDLPSALPLTFPLGANTNLSIRAGSDIASHFGIVARPDGISVKYPFENSQEMPNAGFGLSVDFQPSQPTLLLGTGGKTRLELAGANVGVQANYLGGNVEFILDADLRNFALVLAAGDGDSFLNSLLGNGDKRVEIPAGVEWSSTRGFHLKGGGGFAVELPSHLQLGPVVVEGIQLRLFKPQQSGPRIRTQVGVNLTGQLGPLTATVQGIGIEMDLLFSDGNAGPFDVSLGFRFPDGVGLAVNGGGFTGGGFLEFASDRGQYAGMLELQFKDRLSMKAVGLLDTRLPGGQSGYSLVILITAEFQPIQLGLGFALLCVGGLLGLNRSAMADRLRSGLRDGTLNSILFPQNVVANASRILSDLSQVFPPTPARFIFGPMARIAWGTPALVTLDVGLLLELPNPVRLLILGVLRMVLPKPDVVILQLHVNFLGVVDFDAGTLSFDASIYDSNLLGTPLFGDMAVRAKWKGDSNLLLTVGGFHPLYQPPPLSLPPLKRLTMQLLSGDPRLTLETYFALTSNTIQFGARLELYAGAGSFSIQGYLSFDTLFQQNPFYFNAAIGAMLALRSGSDTIASIKLDFTLEGPTSYHAHGKATLQLFWFLEVSVHFDKTWGEQRDTRLDDVAVLPLLATALSAPGNWQASLPAGKNLLVTLRQADHGTALVVSPLGTLTISQKVVPLDVDIQKVGAQSPSDATHFAIQGVVAGQGSNLHSLDTAAAQDDFAPAQFFNLSDTDKLSGKSFEKYSAGVTIQASEDIQAAHVLRRPVNYEVFYKDQTRVLARGRDRFPIEALTFQAWSVGGSVAQSALSHARRAASAGGPSAVAVRQEPYSVVFNGDLSPVEAGRVFASQAEAQSSLARLLRQQPGLEGDVQIVPSFTLNQG